MLFIRVLNKMNKGTERLKNKNKRIQKLYQVNINENKAIEVILIIGKNPFESIKHFWE